jgi:STE24 endopeptidase
LTNEDRATRYHRLIRRAEILSAAAAGVFLFLLLLTGASVFLREKAAIVGTLIGLGFEEPGTVAGYTVFLILLLQIIELPFAFYQRFLLEHRYGLSNETLGQWTRDQLKGLALAVVFAVAGASIVYWTIRTSPDWWWAIAAGSFTLLMVGLVQLAPVLLLPLFYTFRPLDRPALVERLTHLSTRARTRIAGVYEWVLSAHTKKANAALAGLGRTRRILLSDTLLADYSDDEIEVVLAHELSHHVHHDLWRGVALQTLLLFVTFVIAGQMLSSLAGTFDLRGADDPAGLPLLLLVGGVSAFVFTPLVNAVSRAHERRADRYALDTTGQPDAFISAMKRLSQQNLAEDNPSRLVQWMFYSHPPIRERIDVARRWRAQSGQPSKQPVQSSGF